MHYEINVSLDGQHVFATHPRSLPDLAKAAKVYDMLTRAFPAREGFIITATRQYEMSERCTEDVSLAAYQLRAKEGKS